MKFDSSVQGSWNGVYGQEGQAIASDVTNYPGYAQVTFSGAYDTYLWSSSTSDLRALQKGGGSGRIAAAWESASSYVIDVNFSDSSLHQVALY